MVEGKAPSVLVVEDYADTRDSLVVMLSMSGYLTVGVANGQQALDYLHSNPLPSLILLDLRMPVMSGVEFLQRRQADPALAAIPVLVYSGGGALAQEAATYGVPAYCAKPGSPDQLLGLVASFCEGPHAVDRN